MMTKVLVLGGSGMLGSMVVDVISRESGLAVTASVRSAAMEEALAPRFPGVEFRIFDPAAGVSPELFEGQAWVINAIGITKPLIRDDRADEIDRAIEINARLPYQVAHAARAARAQVLQIATDCVYSGGKGRYVESDVHDALDVYGKSKSLGETFHDNVHHLRCSIIGPEPKDFKFLIEWFRRQPKGSQLNGFMNHQWNGVTTLHFARICLGIITRGVALGHLIHIVPTGTLSKAEMLHQFGRSFSRPDLAIRDVTASTVVDRTLDTNQPDLNREVWNAAGYQEAPSVPDMIQELADFNYRAVLS
jgi:dTDP-4-dehydrorhamnose reductase